MGVGFIGAQHRERIAESVAVPCDFKSLIEFTIGLFHRSTGISISACRATSNTLIFALFVVPRSVIPTSNLVSVQKVQSHLAFLAGGYEISRNREGKEGVGRGKSFARFEPK